MPEVIPVVVPRQNTNDDQAVLVHWLVESGSRVAADQPVVVLETTKAAFEVHAPAEGFLVFTLATKIMVDVGATIAWVADHADFDPHSTPPPGETSAAVSGERFSRKALKLIKEAGLSLAAFPGTQRVEVSDVERAIAAGAAGAVAPASAAPAPAPAGVERLEQSSSKMIEAATLERVYRAIVPSTVTIAVDDAAVQRRLAALAVEHGPISLLELVIFEVLDLYAEYPDLHGYFSAGQAYGYQKPAVGFAVNAGRSLKLPIVRGEQVTVLLDAVRQVRDLFLSYMRDELTSAQLSGGTFTVTDLSAQGVVHFIPVLYERQCAILGICAVRPGTGTRDLVLTIDHRMSDGMRAADFLSALRERLEA
jgi:2-oxoglutarate dehydrogenase E2 component (dihydrolipoamide succinyltransferase)